LVIEGEISGPGQYWGKSQLPRKGLGAGKGTRKSRGKDFNHSKEERRMNSHNRGDPPEME